ncbi:MAG: hypothetical protein R3C99_17960 [Pirellulaceae bacterium]
MRKLNYRRTLDVAIIPNPGQAVTRFFGSTRHGWATDAAASTALVRVMHRGNWKPSRIGAALEKTVLSKLFPSQKPLPPSRENLQIAYATRPADLVVRIVPQAERLRFDLAYTFYFVGAEKEVTQPERRHWKNAVDEDIQQLEAFVYEQLG